MSRLVVITGGAGYLGSKLAGILLREGYNVLAIDNLTYEQSYEGFHNLYPEYGDQFSFHLLDIRNFSVIEEMLQNLEAIDSIIHFGDLSSVYACNHNSVLTNEISKRASTQLINFALKNRIPLIYNSTSSLYGASKDYKHWTESDSLPQFSDLYCDAKAFVEGEIFRLADQYKDSSFIVLRPATVFGPSPRFRIELLPNHFTYSAISRGRIRVSDSNSNRAFVSIDVLCNIYFRIIKDKLYKNRVYNVGTYNLSKLEIASVIQRVVPCKIVTSDEKGDPRDLRISCERFNSELFQLPNPNLATELENTAEFIKAHIPKIEDTGYRGLLNMPLSLWNSLI